MTISKYEAAFRADLRQKLYEAIIGENASEGDRSEALGLPLDAIISELAYALATVIALHPGLQNTEDRKAAINLLAKGIDLEAATISSRKDWEIARRMPGGGNA